MVDRPLCMNMGGGLLMCEVGWMPGGMMGRVDSTTKVQVRTKASNVSGHEQGVGCLVKAYLEQCDKIRVASIGGMVALVTFSGESIHPF